MLTRVLPAAQDPDAVYSPDAPLVVYARTATGMLAIEAHGKGVASMLLPALDQVDGDLPEESSLCTSAVKLSPMRGVLLRARAKGLGAAVLVGFVLGAVAVSLASRLTGAA